MSDSNVIEIEDLWFSYNRNVILREVNLEIHGGDFLAIIGPNGGGKTTLIKLMLGILEPNRGTIKMFGRPPREAALRIGYIPQHIHTMKGFPISVQDVVLIGCLRGSGGWQRFSKSDRKRAQEALDRMGMWQFRKHHLDDLSGGQRQRVFVARALVSDPELLLLDEPTAGIDPKGQTEFYDLLKELNKRVTIVVVSHDLMALSAYIRSVACVNQQLFFHDAPYITKEMLEMAYHCPVELIAHGVPHRVLDTHQEE